MDSCSLKGTVRGPFYTCAHRDDATLATSTFCLRQEKDDQKVVLEEKDLEVIGAPIIKYGDSTVIVQHSESGLWLSYKVCVSAALPVICYIQLVRTTLPLTTLNTT